MSFEDKVMALGESYGINGQAQAASILEVYRRRDNVALGNNEAMDKQIRQTGVFTAMAVTAESGVGTFEAVQAGRDEARTGIGVMGSAQIKVGTQAIGLVSTANDKPMLLGQSPWLVG